MESFLQVVGCTCSWVQQDYTQDLATFRSLSYWHFALCRWSPALGIYYLRDFRSLSIQLSVVMFKCVFKEARDLCFTPIGYNFLWGASNTKSYSSGDAI